MSVPDILAKARARITTLKSSLGLQGQLLGGRGVLTGNVLYDVGSGKLVNRARTRVGQVRTAAGLGRGFFSEITDDLGIANASIEGFPAVRDEGRAVSAYGDAAIYME